MWLNKICCFRTASDDAILGVNSYTFCPVNNVIILYKYILDICVHLFIPLTFEMSNYIIIISLIFLSIEHTYFERWVWACVCVCRIDYDYLFHMPWRITDSYLIFATCSFLWFAHSKNFIFVELVAHAQTPIHSTVIVIRLYKFFFFIFHNFSYESLVYLRKCDL